MLNYRDILINGTALSRRAKLNIIGATGADNSVDGTTDVTLLEGGASIYATDLTALEGAIDRARIYCDGHTSRFDGGGGEFVWHDGDTTTADGGTVFGAGPGRWKRVYSGPLNMAWYGPITAARINAALVIQNALGGGSATVPPRSTMAITGVGSDRILMLSNTSLVFGPGCTIDATGIGAGQTGYVFFFDTTTTDKESILVDGNGLVVTCNRGTTWAPATHQQYGIYFNVQTAGDVCRDIIIRDVTIQNASFDGINIGGNPGCFSESILLERVKCIGCRRNGGAISGAVKGFKAIDCEFTDTDGSTIQSGFDIECDLAPPSFLSAVDMVFIGCKFNRNSGQGLYGQSATWSVTARATFVDCEAHDNGGIGFSATVPNTQLDRCRAFRNTDSGFNLGKNSHANGCFAQDNATGFELHSGSTAAQCTARWNVGSGFSVDSVARGTDGSILTACTSYANRGKGYDVSNAKNSQLIGCTAFLNRLDGVRLGSSHHCQVVGGLYAANGQVSDAGSDNIIVEANATLNNIGGGVQLRMSPSFFRGVAVVDATYTTTTRTKLHASASTYDDDYTGMFVRVISGTNSGAYGIITDYDGTNQYITTYWDSSVADANSLTGTIPSVAGTAGALAAACDGTSTMEIVGARAFTGTVESATSTTFTLQDEIGSWTNDVFNGFLISVVSGTGSADANRTRRITDYDGATQTGTIPVAWTTTLDHTSVVEIIGIMRPRYGLRIDGTCALNRYQDVDAYYAGTTGAISDAGSSSTTANRTT